MPAHGKTFVVADYVIFSAMLVVSLLIGVFHAFTGGRQRTSKEYHLANREMSAWPVALSLLASFMSAITILGTPAEIYVYGTMFCLFGLSYTLVCMASAHIFMPVFYPLRFTSVYEYLERRFSLPVRVCGAMTFILQMVMYMGIVIYAPSLALNAVTGFSLWGSILSVGCVCTLYTTIGGIKAVLWTDVFQVCVMITGFLAVVIQGSVSAGGWSNVMEAAHEGDRIDFFDFNPDPTIRNTFWTIIVGGFFTWTAVYGVNQSQVQRYLTCKSLRTATIAIYINNLGLILILALAACSGLAMYSRYQDCDPYTAGYIDKTDQLMPYFVLDILSFLPGLPGVFVACMFSGALSTVSSGLNSLAAVTGEDLLKSCHKKLPDEKYTFITKIIAFCYGLFSLFMAWIASQMGDVLQAALSIFGMIGGPLMGVFSLGILFPWANSIGALVGLFSGLAMAFWVGIGAFIYPPYVEKPPLTADGCLENLNNTLVFSNITAANPYADYPAVAEWYSISYLYFGAVAWLSVIVFGMITSLITGLTNPKDLDPRLVLPIYRNLKCFKFLKLGANYTGEQEYSEKYLANAEKGETYPMKVEGETNNDKNAKKEYISGI